MKKVMLFIVSMLFAASVSAASMDLSVGTTSGLGNANVAVGTGSALFATGSTHVEGASIAETFNILLSEASTWAFRITSNPAANPFSATIDGVTYAAVGADIIFNVLLDAGEHILSIAGTATSTFTGYDVKINAVPVPAALFLFAPALLGFFGLRRKASLAA